MWHIAYFTKDSFCNTLISEKLVKWLAHIDILFPEREDINLFKIKCILNYELVH